MSKTLCPRDQGFNFLKSVVGLSHTSGHGCGHYENIKKKKIFFLFKSSSEKLLTTFFDTCFDLRTNIAHKKHFIIY